MESFSVELIIARSLIYSPLSSIHYINHFLLEKSIGLEVFIVTQRVVISPLDSTIRHWINRDSLESSIGFRTTYSVDSDVIYTE